MYMFTVYSQPFESCKMAKRNVVPWLIEVSWISCCATHTVLQVTFGKAQSLFASNFLPTQ